MEEWSDIEVTDGRMQVSSLGGVRSRNGRNGLSLPNGEWRLCNLSDHDDGYKKIGVCGRTRLVHDLVAQAFLPPKPHPDCEVDHKDRCRSNNVATNLQWLDKTGNNRKIFQQDCGNTQRLSAEEAANVKYLLNRQFSGPEVQAIYPHASIGMISNIRVGRTWHWL